MSQTRIIDELVGLGSTTGASTVTLISATPPNNINTLGFAWVIANAAGNERATWFRSGAVHKDGAGVLTLDSEGDIFPSFSTNGIKHAAIAVVINGGSIELRATGDGTPGAPDITWQAVVRFFRS